MNFAQAYQKAYEKKGKKIEIPKKEMQVETDPERVPMMYRAQIQGRCSLQYAGKDNDDLPIWTEEWIDPVESNSGKPRYQYSETELGWDGSIYRLKVEFPFRLYSDCGSDTIGRPVMGKNGIPVIPGSGIKGLFRRLCYSPQVSEEAKKKVKKYCGSDDEPGILRFHRAYPIGNWANRLQDLVHPQQNRQVGKPVKGKGTPSAMISFYKPQMVFELSSSKSLTTEDWQQIGGLLKTALRQGMGGKTSTGYGLPYQPTNNYDISLALIGDGISPLLLTGEAEFRPNVFKATLRGHVRRLLAGFCSETDVERQANYLFGGTASPGVVDIYWESRKINYDTVNDTYIYHTEGNLHLRTPPRDTEFLKWVLKFTLTMAGVGKSWRRVWHQKFYQQDYNKLIGCHWQCDYIGTPRDISDWTNEIQTKQQLKDFLDQLETVCRDYIQVHLLQPLNWREAWHPKRVAVYSKVSDKSLAVELFHNEVFKFTPAIGGRNPGDKRPKFVSSVWHRMLPITNNKYLEIVTVFHGDRTPWTPRGGESQLAKFTEALTKQGLELTWGKSP